MRRCNLLIFFVAVCFFPLNVFAWSDIGTHPKITEKAAEQSNLKTTDYLKNNLGFKSGLSETIYSGTSIEQLLSDGARTEDTGILDPAWYPPKYYKICSRGLNHFYNPTKSISDSSAGLSDLQIGKNRYSNPLWAIGPEYGCSTSAEDDPSEDEQWSNSCNSFNWYKARQSFYAALTKKDVEQRNKLLARTFRSVGQVAHLVEDMAVPAHVRNDMKGHLYYQELSGINPGNCFGNNFEAFVKKHWTITSAENIPEFQKLTDFWDTDKYNDDNVATSASNAGLAEYTSANFLSEWRMTDVSGFPHPSEKDGSIDYGYPEQVIAEDGKTDYRFYFKKTAGEPVEHLMATGYLNKYTGAYQKYLSNHLDEICYAEYASKLVPKAVSYAAGVINYFFRGTLKVTEAFIIEGDSSGITKTKAKVVNTTPNNGAMPGGKLFAFARYTTNPDAKDFSYAVSNELQEQSIDSENPQDFTFDFSGNAISPNVKELYLHVVYYGTLGQEEDTGVAIGMEEVPLDYMLLKSGDYYTVFAVFSNSVATNFKNPKTGENFVFPVRGSASNHDDFYEAYIKNDNLTDAQPSLMGLYENLGNPAVKYDYTQTPIPAYENTVLSREGQLPGFDSTYTCRGPLDYMIPESGRYTFEGLIKNILVDENDYKHHWWKVNNQGDTLYAADYVLEDLRSKIDDDYSSTRSDEASNSMPPAPGGLASGYLTPECLEWCQTIAELNNQVVASYKRTSNIDRISKDETTRRRITPLGPLYEHEILEVDEHRIDKTDNGLNCYLHVEGPCSTTTDGICSIYRVVDDKLSHISSGYSNPSFFRNGTYLEMDDTLFRGYYAAVDTRKNFVFQYFHGLVRERDIIKEVNALYPQISYGPWSMPTIYFNAQLNYKERLYNETNQTIAFDPRTDKRRNGPFEAASKALVKAAFDSCDMETYKYSDSFRFPSYDAQFVRLKK
jgi:hypothetical protein